MAIQKSGKVESTPKKKRTHIDMEAGSGQVDTAAAMSDFRRDIQAQSDKIDVLSGLVKLLVENSEYAERYSLLFNPYSVANS